jgi:uncharacterized phage protein (TIGR02216 family)
MQFGLGILHLPPDAFWRMTLREYDAALAGHNRFHGGDTKPDIDVPGMRSFIDEMKAKHPDNPA